MADYDLKRPFCYHKLGNFLTLWLPLELNKKSLSGCMSEFLMISFETLIIGIFWIQIWSTVCVSIEGVWEGKRLRSLFASCTIYGDPMYCYHYMIPQWLLYNTKWFGQIRTIFQSLLAGYQCSQQKDLLLPVQKRQFNSDNWVVAIVAAVLPIFLAYYLANVNWFQNSWTPRLRLDIK